MVEVRGKHCFRFVWFSLALYVLEGKRLVKGKCWSERGFGRSFREYG